MCVCVLWVNNTLAGLQHQSQRQTRKLNFVSPSVGSDLVHVCTFCPFPPAAVMDVFFVCKLIHRAGEDKSYGSACQEAAGQTQRAWKAKCLKRHASDILPDVNWPRFFLRLVYRCFVCEGLVSMLDYVIPSQVAVACQLLRRNHPVVLFHEPSIAQSSVGTRLSAPSYCHMLPGRHVSQSTASHSIPATTFMLGRKEDAFNISMLNDWYFV